MSFSLRNCRKLFTGWPERNALNLEHLYQSLQSRAG